MKEDRETSTSEGGSGGGLDAELIIIACQVLQDILERLVPPDLAKQITFTDYGLHRVPAKMTQSLQEVVNGVGRPGLVVLGYGLCGNGLDGIRAGRHTLLVPRADDCISLLLGSRQAYMREFRSAPGTYYLSKGWLESGSHPLSEYEEYAQTYGPKDALWILDEQYQHYERVALVAHSRDDLEKYRPAAQRVARFCERWDMRYEEILGSERYLRRLIEAAVALRSGDGELAASVRHDFVVVPAGGKLRQDAFLR
ncbi:MAG: DUF1638 domain-containing protein [Anaerolineae bacterium]|jgi:hypothetical protein